MDERDAAIGLANRILDRAYADPDDDLAVLSRQLLRALERPTRADLDRAVEAERGETMCFVDSNGNRCDVMVLP